MGFFNDYQTLRGNYTNYQYARPIASKGYRPHLAALPIIKDDSIWTRNRRIFEVSNDENTSRIVSSLEWFYRKNDEDVLSYPFFGYVHDTSKTMFSYVYLQNEYGQTIRPFIKSYNQVNKAKVPIDTIFSDWFDIKDYNQMKFYGYNKGTQQISVIIERQKDNKKYLVTTPILGGKIIKHQYHLFNSGKNKFRLLFVKNTRNPIYREELIIGGLPDINDFQNNFNNRYGRTYEESQEQLIDLGDMPELRNENGLSLSIYPNPTDEKIFATAYLPLVTKGNRHNLIIRIFTSLGYEIFRQEARPGETLSIQTKDYPQGAYFIRAEEKTDDYTLDTLPAVMQGFVVKR